MKLAIALFAISASALAQTPAPAPAAAPAKPVTHHAATSTAASNPASTLPKVVGVPHTLYSLKYIDTKIGTGALAEPRKFYTVNYTGWFPDGKKFDSSFDHKEPFTFPYGAQRVIIGWDTGFEGMRVGGKRRLFVPYQLAYGLLGRPPQMPPKSNLIFDVELVSFSDKPPAPPANAAPRPTPPKPGTSTPPPPGSTPPPATAPATAPPATAPAMPPPASAPTTPPAATPPATAPAPAAKPATPPTQ